MQNNQQKTNLIAKGRFSSVYLFCKEGKCYANKEIDRTKLNKKTESQIINEINILQKLNHKHIIKYIRHEITKHHYRIITDYYAGGSLSTCLCEYKEKYGTSFYEVEVQHIMRQIVDGLQYLHHKDIIHRDLKLDNIFVQFEDHLNYNKKNMLKAKYFIGDFGSACEGTTFYSVQGTPANMTPSLLNQHVQHNNYSNESFDKSADIWALGTICYEMITGHRLFNGTNIYELQKNVESGKFSLPLYLSFEIVSFIATLVQYDRNKRPTIDEISKHPLLRNSQMFYCCHALCCS